MCVCVGVCACTDHALCASQAERVTEQALARLKEIEGTIGAVRRLLLCERQLDRHAHGPSHDVP